MVINNQYQSILLYLSNVSFGALHSHKYIIIIVYNWLWLQVLANHSQGEYTEYEGLDFGRWSLMVNLIFVTALRLQYRAAAFVLIKMMPILPHIHIVFL